MRQQFLDALYSGQPFRAILRELGLTSNQVWGLTRTDDDWRAALETALAATRRDDLQHGTNARLRGRLRVCRLPSASARANGQQPSEALGRGGEPLLARTLVRCGGACPLQTSSSTSPFTALRCAARQSLSEAFAQRSMSERVGDSSDGTSPPTETPSK